MCGICGYYTLKNNSTDNLPSLIKKMTDTLTHRGPDDEGYFCTENVALGHRRLSIIDLKGGKQPIYNEDKTITIIFNGEIYNYKKIRQSLKLKGHVFTTDSDTEVILHLYEERGKRCVDDLRGMFSFVIYDKKDHSIFAARDRLGIKPFYYSYQNGKFIFGSEIKAILKSGEVNKDIDYQALSDYLTFLYIPAPKSIFSSIKKLPAGYSLFIKNGKISLSQYWDIDFSKTEQYTEEEWIEQLDSILKDAVKMRMISDVPLGGFLSGGIDSSCIIGIMSQLSNGSPVITNSIGFNEAEFNELNYAKQTSLFLKSNHHEYTVSIDHFDILDDITRYYDEPFADSSAIPTYFVSKMARKNVTVALSGDGGDENFAGYRRYFFDKWENQFRGLFPSQLRNLFLGPIAKIYPKADWLPQIFRAKTLLTNLSLNPIEGYFNSMAKFNNIRSILGQNTINKLKGYNSFDVFAKHYKNANTDDLLSRIQYLDIKTYLVDDILTKVDRASMANSLEVRVPLLDHVFMQHIATMPSSLKLNGKNGKYLFKKLTSKYIPESFLNRKKMGFSIPIDKWFRKELKLLMYNEVFSRDSFSKNYFNMDNLKKMMYEHQTGVRNYGTQLWIILMFEKWAKMYF